MSALDNFKIELMSVNLYIRKLTSSPGILLVHAQALMKASAKFPVSITTCSVISVSAGHPTYIEDNLYLGQLPETIVIGMVEDDTFTGLCTKNSYNFKNFDLTSKCQWSGCTWNST